MDDTTRATQAPLGATDNRGLADRAVADLRFIREAMERSGQFTAVPGRAWMTMGGVAVAAALTASLVESLWLPIWITAAALSAVIGSRGIQTKAYAQNVSLFAGPGRMFLLGLCPPLVAGAVLTVVFVQLDLLGWLPGLWLLLYGAAVISGGAFSVPVVPVAGAGFMIAGGLTMALPEAWGNTALAAGFGGIHLVFGYVVWRRHGG